MTNSFLKISIVFYLKFLKLTDYLPFYVVFFFLKYILKSEILTLELEGFFPLCNKPSPTVFIISEGFVLLIERGGC